LTIMLRFINIILFLAAFLLLLLVSISLPVTRSITYFSLTANFDVGAISTGVSGGVSFGNWGWCTTPLVVEVLGFDRTEPGECSNAKIGWTIDQRLVDLLHLQGLEDAVNSGLTVALILNPIACGVTFLTLLCVLWFAWKQSRLSAIIGVCIGLLAAILTTIAFIIDIVVMTLVKKNVENISSNFHVTYGQTTWMTLAAMILIWIGIIVFCIAGFRGRRVRRKETY